MTKIRIRLCLILFGLLAFINASRAETRFLASVDGKKYVSVVRSSDVEATPDWNPAQGNNPPLSISEAFRIARKELILLLDNGQDQSSSWIANDLQVIRLESWRRKHKW